MLPLQQPFGHDVASHTHAPFVLHSCPGAQAAHAEPPAPHEVLLSEAKSSHVPSAVQQPLGHEVASHTHAPLDVSHSWPAGHATQATPLLPHVELFSLPVGSHVVPLQHPAHEAPPQLHAPSVHACPELHGVQAAPPVPHSEELCDTKVTHVLPLQQPVAHEVESQTHCPLPLHSWPMSHAAQVAPPVPHDADVSEP